MCLILFSYAQHPRYRVVLASNRDEFLERPTKPADRWTGPRPMVAGKDLKAGGAWLGISTEGRFATVTNFRESTTEAQDAPTRGRLAPDFIFGDLEPEAYIEQIHQSDARYNGFNLLLGDSQGLWWYSNRHDDLQWVEPGLHGLSNHLLNTPWPKVERGKARLEKMLRADRIDPDSVFDMLKDDEPAPDEMLPDTGVGIEWERRLSPMFIRTPHYGTRCSSLLLIDYSGHATFYERTYPADGGSPFEKSFEI